MAWDSAAVGGIFALGGVAVQQAFATFVARRQRVDEQLATSRQERRDLYVAFVVQGRRVQRALKESGTDASDIRIQTELDRLAEASAAIRLAAPAMGREVEYFEDDAQKAAANRPTLEDAGNRLRLTPTIEKMQDDLSLRA
jgi:hypothetical protein